MSFLSSLNRTGKPEPLQGLQGTTNIQGTQGVQGTQGIQASLGPTGIKGANKFAVNYIVLDQ
jgi:hypothetical protein